MFPIDNFDYWHSGKGYWSDTTDAEWNDWKWQLRNRITKKEQFERYLKVSDSESEGLSISSSKLLVSVTPHFLNLINPIDPNCPIRKQVIPSNHEGFVLPYEDPDPVGEERSMVVSGLVHRYPDRVLFLTTDRCGSYCRYCTRSRLVSNAQGYSFHPNFEKNLDYIKKHTEVRDVLLSGGDPLLLSDSKLSYLISELSNIPHVEFIRLGSRLPVFLPQRVTDGLVDALQGHPNVWMSIHVNHPKECTIELKNACHKLAKSGIPLGNPDDNIDEPWSNNDNSSIKYIPTQADIGDIALFLNKASIEIKIENDDYLIVPQSAILILIRDDINSLAD